MNITDNSFDKYEKSEVQKKIEEEFVMLAHDLKSPIFSQQNALNLLLREKFGNLTDEQREIISLLYNSNNYSVNLVNNILLSYKFAGGNIDLNPEVFDLCMEVKEVLEMLKYTLKEKGNNFNIELPDNCMIFADKIAIKRIITNILSNAIKYSRHNSDIFITVSTNKETVIFTVINFGEYIEEHKIAKFFRKDYKNPPKTLDSNGLGMHITSELIKMHGGNLIAKSYKNDDGGKNIFGFEIKKGN